MTHLKIWLFGILGFVVIVVAAGAVAVTYFHWNWLRPPLEAKLSSLTGKTVKIKGDITGEFAWVPHIVMTDISIEEPSWTQNPVVANVAKVTLAIDLRRLLFHDEVNLPDLEFEKPVIALERGPDGKANWDVAKEADTPSSRSSVPVIGVLKVSDGKLSYRDPTAHLSIDAALATAQAQGGGGGQQMQLKGSGSYQDAPFTLTLAGDPLDNLRNTRKPYQINLAAKLGRSDLKLDGTVTDPIKLTGLDLKLTISGENAADLYTYLHIPAPMTPPFRLTGQLTKQDAIWNFNSFTGTVGHSDLAGSLKFDASRPRLFVSGDLVSRNLSLQDTGILVGAPSGATAADSGKPGQHYVSTDQVQIDKQYQQSDRILPDAPLNIDEVRSVDVDVNFKGEKVVAPNLPLQDVALRVRIDNGELSLQPFHVGVAGGTVEGGILIDARSSMVKTDYDLSFTGFQLKDFFDRSSHPNVVDGTMDGRVKLEGMGDSVRKSLGSANGDVSMIVNHGTMSKLVSDLLGLDVARSLGLLVTGDKPVPLACVVTDFDVRKGMMYPRALVLDTPDTLVTGKGSVNLGDESLHLEITGTPKKPSVSLGGPIEVGGTFRKPSVGLGPQVLARGAVATVIGVVLSPLASIIAFIHPGAPVGADCAGLEQQAQDNAARTTTQAAPAMATSSPAP